MADNWADAISDRIAGDDAISTGRFLLLGAADTGKTTLLSALADRLARRGPVAVVDADVGQSHIGPPTTVGWTLLSGEHRIESARLEAAELEARGIAFVGDVTPVGHLLQLTAALSLCVEQAAQAAEAVLIDTPGLVAGGAACTLWWTIQRLIRPRRIIAIQRQNELGELLRGLQPGLAVIDLVQAPPHLRRKSPESRQQHRGRLFERYFRDADARRFELGELTMRVARPVTPDDAVGRVVGLTDRDGRDVAIGVVERWHSRLDEATIRTPQRDVERIRCLTIGDARIDTRFAWS